MERTPVAGRSARLLVRSLAVETTGAIHADAPLVREVDHTSAHDLLCFVVVQFIDHGHDPAVFLHEARIISTPSSQFCVAS
jgi:hypothetical protein